MITKHTKHFKPPKGWTLVQWAKQCWNCSPASKRAGSSREQFTTALLLNFRGMESL
jgi:hypothetical protein